MNEVTEFDGIKVGDIITAYHAGFHRVVGFHDLPHTTKQVDYQTVLTQAGQPHKGRNRSTTKSCHIGYCKVVTEAIVRAQFEAEVKAAEEKRNNLLSILTEGEIR